MNRAEKIERLQNILLVIENVEKNIARYEKVILAFKDSPFPSSTERLDKSMQGLHAELS